MSQSAGFQEVACAPDLLESDLVVAFVFADQRPLAGVAALLDWRLNGLVTRMLQAGQLSGRLGEDLVIRSNGKVRAEWILFLGCGAARDLNPQRWTMLFVRLWQILIGLGHASVALGLQPFARRMEDDLSDVAKTTWRQLAEPRPVCQVSFDRSWLHR